MNYCWIQHTNSADFVVVVVVVQYDNWTLPKMIGQTVASFLDRIFSIFLIVGWYRLNHPFNYSNGIIYMWWCFSTVRITNLTFTYLTYHLISSRLASLCYLSPSSSLLFIFFLYIYYSLTSFTTRSTTLYRRRQRGEEEQQQRATAGCVGCWWRNKNNMQKENDIPRNELVFNCFYREHWNVPEKS